MAFHFKPFKQMGLLRPAGFQLFDVGLTVSDGVQVNSFSASVNTLC